MADGSDRRRRLSGSISVDVSDNRLREVLRRQTRAAAERQGREKEAADAAAAAAARRSQAEQLWAERSRQLDEAIALLNELMAPNDVQLYRRKANNPAVAGQLDRVEIGLDPGGLERDTRRLMFYIAATGNVSVRMGTVRHMPAKSDHFTLENADATRWIQCLVDFVDINTPGA
jgi:predicted NBD/HSP70 family sugar kinase